MSSLQPADQTPAGYGDLLHQIKTELLGARLQVARSANTELIVLYWRVGKLILDRQNREGWGSKVIARLSADLRSEFPEMRGFAPRSLAYMRSLAAAWTEEPIVRQAAAQLPWGHLQVLLDRLDSQQIVTGTPRRRSTTAGHEKSWNTTLPPA